MTRRAVLVACLLWLSSGVSPPNEIEAEHPSDYARVLETDQPELWEEAAVGLLGEDDELPELAVASVVRRLPSLSPDVQARVARALRDHAWHRDTAETLWRLAHAPMSVEGPDEAAAPANPGEGGAPPPTDDVSPRDAILGLLGESRETALPSGSYDEVRRTARESLLTLRYERYREYFREMILEAGADRIEALQALVETFRDAPVTDFDQRYLPAVRTVLRSPQASDRVAALSATAWLDTPGLRREWTLLIADPVEDVRSRAERVLADHAEEQDAGIAAEEETAPAEPAEGVVAPAVLVASAVLSGIVGVLLFVWAFRLVQLAVRVRYQPTSSVRTLALGPVALEGEVQPSGSYLRRPLTGEPCVYYAGADVDHPNARFYLEDGTGRVLVDPRRAVLFSDDDVLVAGERVHLVGFADRDAEGNLVVHKDRTPPPLYRRFVHGAIQTLFGFGRASSVTRMLFSDPHRCFWIWDDLDRRPMGEAKDVLWLAGGILLGGAWMIVFGLAVVGLVDAGALTGLLQGL